MANLLSDIGEMLFLLVSLGFLIINYNFNISNIYMWLTLIGLLLYLIPVLGQSMYPPFRKLVASFYPVEQSFKGRVFSIIIAVVAGFVFVWVNSLITLTSTIKFATAPILANSDTTTKIVFILMVTFIETILFFRTLPAWYMWLIGASDRDSIFTVHQIIGALFGAGLFAMFHLTSHGLDNTAMIASVLFGLVSIGMIYYFKQAREAIIFHMVVNAIAIGIFSVGLFSMVIS